MFLWLKQLFNAKATDFQTTLFQCSKNYGCPTRVTRLKSGTKHGWPNQYQRLKTVALITANLLCEQQMYSDSFAFPVSVSFAR